MNCEDINVLPQDPLEIVITELQAQSSINSLALSSREMLARISNPPSVETDQNSETDQDFCSASFQSDDALLNNDDIFELESDKTMSFYIKNELRWKIHSRRHTEGKPDLSIEDCIGSDDNKNPVELSEEERSKVEKRRQKNREAARKCRNKKKSETHGLAQKLDDVRKENNKLRKALKAYVQENEHLRGSQIQHETMCPLMNSFTAQLEDN